VHALHNIHSALIPHGLLVDTQPIATGLYEVTHQRDILITSTFDDGPDCLAITSAWQGTHVPMLLADRLANLADPVAVEQQVRLRVLRRGQASAPNPDRPT
jgi:hypothetical protein